MPEKLDKYANDPQLHLSFAPADVRTHFDGAGMDDMLEGLSDESLAQAARDVIWTDSFLDEAAANVFHQIVQRGVEIERARRN